MSQMSRVVEDCVGYVKEHPIVAAVGVVGLIYTSKKLQTCRKNKKESQRLNEIIKRKQNERTASFESLSENFQLTREREAIVKLSVDDLIEKLTTRSLKAQEVYEAYLAKALEVNKKTNSITEFVPWGLQMAKNLDSTSTIKGPLHGLPIAFKEDHDIEGMDTTIGFARKLYKPATKNCTLTEALMSLGAVPLCKTNVPQTLMSFGSENPIFGITFNHEGEEMAPGGSSSGSGALVGGGGCPVATGTDIGGSVRIPAHMSGIATIRPTLNRLSGKGIMQAIPDIVGFKGVPGIFAHRPSVVAKIFEHLTIGNNLLNKLDGEVVPIPWNKAEFESSRKLRIGYFTSMNFMPPIGDTVETVLRAKAVLESFGHELIIFDPPDSASFLKLTLDLYFADNSSYHKEMLKGDQVCPPSEGIYSNGIRSQWCRNLRAFLTSINFPPFNVSWREKISLLMGMDVQSREGLTAALVQKRKLYEEIMGQMKDKELDLILSPAFPFPAPKARVSPYILAAIVYTVLWNLVDFPAGIVNFGTESGHKAQYYDTEDDPSLEFIKDAMKDSAGMPIGVQIIGMPYKEELVLRALVELDDFKEGKKQPTHYVNK